MIPGSNLLNTALSVISKQFLTYYQANGRTVNAVGQYVTSFVSPAPQIAGSFQPVPRSRYEYNGLDFQKDYFVFYVSKDLIDIQRDVSTDELGFGSQRYQCISATPWIAIDGWVEMLCVLITGQAN